MTGFSKMIDFLTILACNNNREWFLIHKQNYEDIRQECLTEITELIRGISKFDPNLRGVEAKDCIYRIYRDTRFSADKTPYKTHFGIVLGKNGKKCKQAAAYLHLEPGHCALYGGVWFPEQPILTRLRHDIDDNIEEFLSIIHNKDFSSHFPKLVGDSLKTMSKGFPREHPHADILRMKEFLVMEAFPDSFFQEPASIHKITDEIKLMKPFFDFLNFSFEEMHNM